MDYQRTFDSRNIRPLLCDVLTPDFVCDSHIRILKTWGILGTLRQQGVLLQPFRHQPVCCDPGSTRPRPNNLPAGHVLRPNVRLTKKGNFTLLSARFSEMVRLLNYIISRYTKLVGSWGRLLVHSFTIILSYLITARQLFNNHLFIISVSDQSRRSVEAKLLSETCIIFQPIFDLVGV